MKSIRNIFCLLLFVLAAKGVFAQHSNKKPLPVNLKERMHIKLQEITAQEKNLFPVKKTRSSSRLIARANRMYNGATYDITDSFTYAYNSNYGYDPTPETFETDYINTYLYYNQNNLYDASKHYMSMGGPLTLSDSTANTFGGNHKLVNNYTDNFAFGMQETYNYQYNANEKKTVELDSMYNNGTINKFKYTFAYNANGKVIELRGSSWDAGAWVEEELDTLIYDGTGRLTQVKVYSYDIPNAIWVNDYLMNYTYNAGNKITAEIAQAWNGASWDNDYKTENIYNAGNKLLSVTSSSWDGANWVYDSKDSFIYAAGNYPVTAINIYWDDMANAWVNSYKNDYTYNAANQIETILNHSWNTGTNTWDISDNATLYYQNYTPESVNTVSELSAELTLYPVPVQDILNIEVSLAEKQNTEIIILDITGNPVLTKVSNTDAKFLQVLNTASLPSGNYILLLKGEKGTLSRKFTK